MIKQQFFCQNLEKKIWSFVYVFNAFRHIQRNLKDELTPLKNCNSSRTKNLEPFPEPTNPPPTLSRFPLSASQCYILSCETVLMVRFLRGTFQFDQPYKQTENKIEVTGKISSNQ